MQRVAARPPGDSGDRGVDGGEGLGPQASAAAGRSGSRANAPGGPSGAAARARQPPPPRRAPTFGAAPASAPAPPTCRSDPSSSRTLSAAAWRYARCSPAAAAAAAYSGSPSTGLPRDLSATRSWTRGGGAWGLGGVGAWGRGGLGAWGRGGVGAWGMGVRRCGRRGAAPGRTLDDGLIGARPHVSPPRKNRHVSWATPRCTLALAPTHLVRPPRLRAQQERAQAGARPRQARAGKARDGGVLPGAQEAPRAGAAARHVADDRACYVKRGMVGKGVLGGRGGDARSAGRSAHLLVHSTGQLEQQGRWVWAPLQWSRRWVEPCEAPPPPGPCLGSWTASGLTTPHSTWRPAAVWRGWATGDDSPHCLSRVRRHRHLVCRPP
jgi:hypothetical protein